MEFVEKTLEMRSVKRDEIINYFIKINGKEIESGSFVGEGWEVEVGQESLVNLGSFTITEVKVILRCKKELFDKMYSKFRLEFFRAGG